MVATSRDCSAPTVLLISSGRKIVGAEELIDLRVLTLLGQIEETAPRGQARTYYRSGAARRSGYSHALIECAS